MSKNNYSLKFTPKATEDLEQIYSYISKKLFAEIAADNLLEKIETNIMRLKSFPFSCTIVTDEFLKAREYRKLTVENYVVFYKLKEVEKQVIIMRILYGAQYYQDML